MGFWGLSGGIEKSVSTVWFLLLSISTGVLYSILGLLLFGGGVHASILLLYVYGHSALIAGEICILIPTSLRFKINVIRSSAVCHSFRSVLSSVVKCYWVIGLVYESDGKGLL